MRSTSFPLHLLLSVLAACLSSHLAQAANYAILVGVDYTPAGQKWAIDATNMNNALLSPNQGALWNTMTYTGLADVGVGPGAVLGGIAADAAKAKAGDSFFFYYSGHGSYVQDLANPERPLPDPLAGSKDETTNRSTLYMTEKGNANLAGQIEDTALANALNAFNPGVNKLVFLDSCFAGGFWSGIPKANDLEIVPKTSLIAASDENSPAPGDSQISKNFVQYLAKNKFDLSKLNSAQLQAIYNQIAPGGAAQAGNGKDGPDPTNNPYGYPYPDIYDPEKPPIPPDQYIPETPQFFSNAAPCPPGLVLFGIGGSMLLWRRFRTGAARAGVKVHAS